MLAFGARAARLGTAHVTDDECPSGDKWRLNQLQFQVPGDVSGRLLGFLGACSRRSTWFSLSMIMTVKTEAPPTPQD